MREGSGRASQIGSESEWPPNRPSSFYLPRHCDSDNAAEQSYKEAAAQQSLHSVVTGLFSMGSEMIGGGSKGDPALPEQFTQWDKRGTYIFRISDLNQVI